MTLLLDQLFVIKADFIIARGKHPENVSRTGSYNQGEIKSVIFESEESVFTRQCSEIGKQALIGA